MTTTQIENNWLVLADLFRIASMGFSYPDDASLAQRKTLVQELLASKSLNDEQEKLIAAINESYLPEEILADYSRLYIQKGIPQTESYCTNNMQAVTDVSAFYKAFGITPKSGDSPDALNYELEFTSILLTKIALASNTDQAEIGIDAYNKFIKDHVKSFVEKFCEKLDEMPASDYTRNVASLMLYLVK